MTSPHPDEVQVKVRYSDRWFWVLRLFPIPVLFLYSYLLRVHVIPLDWLLPSAFGMMGAALLVRFFAYRKRWIATLRSDGLYVRSGGGVMGGNETWTLVPWREVRGVHSVGTIEKGDHVYNRKIRVEYQDPVNRGETGVLSLWSAEACFYQVLEALVKWVDPAKVDADLIRMAEPAHLARLKEMRHSGLKMGLIMAACAISASVFHHLGWHPHLMNLAIAVTCVIWAFVWNRHLRK